MRIIKRNSEAFEREYTCCNCKSIFAFEYSDMYFARDMSDVNVPYVKCPCCGYSNDLECVKNLPAKPSLKHFMDGEDK